MGRVKHFCGILLSDILAGHATPHSWGTLSSDILVGHACGAVLWRLVENVWETLVGHSCKAILWDTLACRTLWYGTRVGHSCDSFLGGHSYGALW